jgi:hypothetical protein
VAALAADHLQEVAQPELAAPLAHRQQDLQAPARLA